MAAFIPLARPDITAAELDAVRAVMESGWLTTGPEVTRFEEEFVGYLSAGAGVALTSATAGLHLALEVMGVGKGDEVIVPDWTFIACAHVVEWLGATPVIVDVEDESLNLCPKAVAEAITARTKVIMPVHFAGLACRMDELRALARDHGLRVLEDAAHAHGATFRGTRIGGPGTDLAAFSFYATKNLATGEGGMLVGDDPALIERARRKAYFGVDKHAFERYSDKGSWYYEVVERGYKYNFDSMHAALGRAQLRRLEAMNARRREIAARYREAFADCERLRLPAERDGDRHSYHLFVMRLRDAALGERDRLIARLREHGIGCSVHFIPLSAHPYYRSRHDALRRPRPVAERAFCEAFSIPLCSAQTDEHTARVIDAVLKEASRSR